MLIFVVILFSLYSNMLLVKNINKKIMISIPKVKTNFRLFPYLVSLH